MRQEPGASGECIPQRHQFAEESRAQRGLAGTQEPAERLYHGWNLAQQIAAVVLAVAAPYALDSKAERGGGGGGVAPRKVAQLSNAELLLLLTQRGRVGLVNLVSQVEPPLGVA
eukprot:scaffold12567_cov55-Phaeocystis_antarctica.AAC.6